MDSLDWLRISDQNLRYRIAGTIAAAARLSEETSGGKDRALRYETPERVEEFLDAVSKGATDAEMNIDGYGEKEYQQLLLLAGKARPPLIVLPRDREIEARKKGPRPTGPPKAAASAPARKEETPRVEEPATVTVPVPAPVPVPVPAPAPVPDPAPPVQPAAVEAPAPALNLNLNLKFQLVAEAMKDRSWRVVEYLTDQELIGVAIRRHPLLAEIPGAADDLEDMIRAIRREAGRRGDKGVPVWDDRSRGPQKSPISLRAEQQPEETALPGGSSPLTEEARKRQTSEVPGINPQRRFGFFRRQSGGSN